MDKILQKLESDLSSKLLDIRSISYKRFFFNELLAELKYVDTITMLKGLRGVGKTTLILQLVDFLLKQRKKVLYFSADNIIFDQTKIYDFVEYLYKHEYEYVFIDEIHLYKNCAQELKNICDDFKIKVVVTGSNGLKLQRAKYDLSRRASIYELPVLSYREYLSIKEGKNQKVLDFNVLLKNYKELSLKQRVSPLDIYWSKGALPFFWKQDDKKYYETVKNILDKLIFEDLLTYNFTSETILKSKKVLLYLAQNPPSEVNSNSIASSSELSRDTVLSLLEAFKDMGIIREIISTKKGKNLLKENKKYLLVPPFRSILCRLSLKDPNLGALREDFFINHTFNLYPQYFGDTKSPDYLIKENIFEIGGNYKNKKQIFDYKSSYVVKDTGFSQDSIPLYLFGYLY